MFFVTFFCLCPNFLVGFYAKIEIGDFMLIIIHRYHCELQAFDQFHLLLFYSSQNTFVDDIDLLSPVLRYAPGDKLSFQQLSGSILSLSSIGCQIIPNLYRKDATFCEITNLASY